MVRWSPRPISMRHCPPISPVGTTYWSRPGSRAGNFFSRPAASWVSMTNLDAASPADFTCWHYLLVKTGESRWDFHYVADHTANHRQVEQALVALLGHGARVSAFRRRAIAPAAIGKFALLKTLVAAVAK